MGRLSSGTMRETRATALLQDHCFKSAHSVAEPICSRRSLGKRYSQIGQEKGRCFFRLRRRVLRMAARNPGQAATEHVNRQRGEHQDGACPEAPVAMYSPPIRAWIRLTLIAAISFNIVLVSGHPSSSPVLRIIDNWHTGCLLSTGDALWLLCWACRNLCRPAGGNYGGNGRRWFL